MAAQKITCDDSGAEHQGLIPTTRASEIQMKSVSAQLFCDLTRRERRHDIDIVRLSQRSQSAKEQAAPVSVECPTLVL
jgi:hypothetical protein